MEARPVTGMGVWLGEAARRLARRVGLARLVGASILNGG
jgi:hypothetical protein